MSNNVANSGLACLGALVVFALVVLLGPFIMMWCINTLILANIAGATLMPYIFFTSQWWACLFAGGTAGGVVSGFAASVNKNN